MKKLTSRERRLGIKEILGEETLSITLKEVVDSLNEIQGKEKGDVGYLRHNRAMKKVETLIGLNSTFGQCPKMGTCYIVNNGASINIETYVLNKKQALTVAASLNDIVLLWVMDRFEEMEIELRSRNQYNGNYNVKRIDVVDSNQRMKDSLLAEYQGREGKQGVTPNGMLYTGMNKYIGELVLGTTPKKYKKERGFDEGDSIRSLVNTNQLEEIISLEEFISKRLEKGDTYKQAKKKAKMYQDLMK